MSVTFIYKYFFHTVGIFSMPQNFTTSNGFTSSSKEVLRIFIALKIPSSSVGFDTKNLGSNGKHDNH
jgi:hypothetical protein